MLQELAQRVASRRPSDEGAELEAHTRLPLVCKCAPVAMTHHTILWISGLTAKLRALQEVQGGARSAFLDDAGQGYCVAAVSRSSTRCSPGPCFSQTVQVSSALTLPLLTLPLLAQPRAPTWGPGSGWPCNVRRSRHCCSSTDAISFRKTRSNSLSASCPFCLAWSTSVTWS